MVQVLYCTHKGTNDDGDEDVKVITHPVVPAMVEWSMFFFCSLAHPSVGVGGIWIFRIIVVPAIDLKKSRKKKSFK